MLMTEDQASTKWCPHARQSAEDFSTYNRMEDGTVSESCLCVASGCMAWRWKRVRDDEGSADGGAAILTQTYGYCGAFGRPEA